MSVLVCGSFVFDYVWRVEHLPSVGESRIGQFQTGPGGKGFNQAVAAHRSGAPTCFVGALGPDAQAETARALAASLQLRCQWIGTEQPTAAASVVVNTRGANLICVALGANLELSPRRLLPVLEKQAPSVVLVQLESDLAGIAYALEWAQSNNVFSVLNPAPINPDATLDLLRKAHLLTPNETEFAHLLEQHCQLQLPSDWLHHNDATIAQWCAQLTHASVLITLGAAGVFVHDATNHAAYRLPAPKANAIDTTGAGDAFNGALVAGLASKLSLRDAAEQALRYASLSVEREGAALSMPTMDEVRARWGD